MTLQNLLTSIKNKDEISKKLFGALTGAGFEEIIFKILIMDKVYTTGNKNDYKKHPKYKEIKEIIQSSSYKKNLIQINNISKYFGDTNQRIIIKQPYGANNYPDFLLIYKDKLLPLEIKSSKNKGNKPTWNGGYPRSKSIYIFGSYGRKDVTSFVGEDYLSQEELNALINIMNYANNKMKERAASEKHYDPHNFSVYLREMYNQVKSSLDNKNRISFEMNSIKIASENDF